MAIFLLIYIFLNDILCVAYLRSGCLAQPGEHHPYKVGVVGSSPSASTNKDTIGYKTRRGSEEAKRG